MTGRPAGESREPWPEMLKTREVAQMFGVSRSTVLSWAYRGLFDYITTPSGQRRFYRDQIEAYLAAQYGHPAEPEQRSAERRDRPYDTPDRP